MEGQELTAEGIIRQWMEIATKYIRRSLPSKPSDEQLHDLLVMEALVQAMPGASCAIDIPYRYHCNNCGNDFEKLKDEYIGDLHKSDWAEVCPHCGYGTHVIEDRSAAVLPPS